jgi:hypothetical protein
LLSGCNTFMDSCGSAYIDRVHNVLTPGAASSACCGQAAVVCTALTYCALAQVAAGDELHRCCAAVAVTPAAAAASAAAVAVVSIATCLVWL